MILCYQDPCVLTIKVEISLSNGEVQKFKGSRVQKKVPDVLEQDRNNNFIA